MQAYNFSALPEQLRGPRLMTAAIVQNAIVELTTAPYSKQRQACVSLLLFPCLTCEHIPVHDEIPGANDPQ